MRIQNTTTSKKLRVLYVEDEIDQLNDMHFIMGDQWNVVTATDPDDVYSGEINLNDIDLIIMGLVFYPLSKEKRKLLDPLPERGYAFLHWIKREHPRIPVVILSGLLDNLMIGIIQTEYPDVLCIRKPRNIASEEFQFQIETHFKLLAD